MPEIRQNPTTKEWVIVAVERAKRPEDFVHTQAKTQAPPFSEDCPFCPGHEDRTPPEIVSNRSGNGDWTIRVVPNRYPALASKGKGMPKWERVREEGSDLFRWMPGFGKHEVIIETPVHNASFGRIEDEKALEILTMYHARYSALSEDKRFKLITIFRNYGRDAGTSLEHPHSQIVATPIVPLHIRHRLEEATRFYDDNGACVFCKLIEYEKEAKDRIVLEDENFIVIEPFASRSPFETWIIPHAHRSTFGELDLSELPGFARILNRVFERFVKLLHDPSYNLVIQTAPLSEVGADYYHWHVKIFPRMTTPAGFELGTGVYINTVVPEAAAKYLRNA
jgi:UDPglucose--hexose-1-phosphate uridylyltransferase